MDYRDVDAYIVVMNNSGYEDDYGYIISGCKGREWVLKTRSIGMEVNVMDMWAVGTMIGLLGDGMEMAADSRYDK